MTLPFATADKTLRIYLALVQYPILSTQIRARMRRELFERGIITQKAFEAEVREQAIRSQAREMLHDPFAEELSEIWELRLLRVRDHLTDFYFAYNLPYELFELIVRQALAERGAETQELMVSFNPELAPQAMLFEQGIAIENLPPDERKGVDARLREIKVVLIRTLISDQLAYVNIAKEWFTINDLREIRNRKIGGGKIGGKSAGMLLAKRILDEVSSEDILQQISIPDSYFLGSDVNYRFMALNDLNRWGDQKYKTEEQMRGEYPQIVKEFLAGEFPPEYIEELRALLDQLGKQPVIVRSSSLLEDNFGTSFAGKYESLFCPNQGTPDQNLRELTKAIQRVYASILNPNALLYRHSKGLQDYDERMAILIQVVQGERFGHFYLPHAAGVAFSRNTFRWSSEIRREEGFVRLVWGLGTRAVDRVGNDYPRLVALSHPLLQPADSAKAIRRYSQQFVDLIDLEANDFKTLPVSEVLSPYYPLIRYLVQVDQGGYLMPLRSSITIKDKNELVLTFEELLRRTPFAKRLRDVLQLLETHYHSPVDTEFTIRINDPHTLQPTISICLLQCRPQSHLKENKVSLPAGLHPTDIIFSTKRVVPEGHVGMIGYVLFVNPSSYYALPTEALRREMARSIGLLNAKLKQETFICIGPGRWGTSNSDLGVPINYTDIYNTRALIELSGQGIGVAPEPSFGTHFFQDLVEAQIYPLAIYLDDKDVTFNESFFYNTPNCIKEWLPNFTMQECLHLIRVSDFRPGHHVELVMDDDKGQAVAYLTPDIY